MDKETIEKSAKFEELLDFITQKCDKLGVDVSMLLMTDDLPPALIVRGVDDDEITGHVEAAASVYAMIMVPGMLERVVRWYREMCEKRSA